MLFRSAKELPGADIVAVDISAAALEIARANAARLQLDQRVTFFENNLLAGFESNLLAAPESNLLAALEGDLLAPSAPPDPSEGKATRFRGKGAPSDGKAIRFRGKTGFFDFVVSNPPYVGEAAPEKVQREVRE